MGGYGKHQKIINFIQLVLMCLGNCSLYPVAFYQLMPQFECFIDQKWQKCTRNDFCENLRVDEEKTSPVPEHRVDWDSDESLHNWVEIFDLECTSKLEIGQLGISMFLGIVIGSIIIPKSSDFYGRKPLVFIGNFIHIISCILIVSSKNLNVLLFAMFIMGAASQGRIVVGFTWMAGHLCTSDITFAVAIMFIIDASANI